VRVLGIVGDSNSGKTRLISLLLPELKKRGFSVAIIKHCAHGFDFGQEDKDSAQFFKAGAESVILVSPGEHVVLEKKAAESDLKALAARLLKNNDFVLVEGGRKDKELQKIEVFRKGISERIESSSEELLAVVSDKEVSTDKPVFHPDQIAEISDFLEKNLESKERNIILECDGEIIPLNPFVQNIIENSVKGMIKSLRGVNEDPKYIILTLQRR